MGFENYPLPPIQEAILDVYATVPESTTLAHLEGFREVIQKEFPEKRPRYNFSSNIKVNFEDASENRSESVTKQTGWIFRTPTKDKAVQARLDGFTCNRLPVYEGWDKFVADAQRLWTSYREFAAPKQITSVALRYINRLKLPLPLDDFRNYCVLFPQTGYHHPKALGEFLLRYGGPSHTVKGGTTTVTVTFEPADNKQGHLPLLIDIHVGCVFSTPLAANDETLWKTFELLRIEKNLVFEESITDKARNLFRK